MEISKILIPEIAKGEPNISIFAIARSVFKDGLTPVRTYLMKKDTKIKSIDEVKGVKFRGGSCYCIEIDDFKVNPLPTKIRDKVKVVFFVRRWETPKELMEDLLYSTQFEPDEVLVVYTTVDKINYIYDRKVNLELYETISLHNLDMKVIAVYEGMKDSITEKRFRRCDIITFDGIIASGYGENKDEAQKDANKWIDFAYKSDSYSYGYTDVSMMDYVSEMLEGSVYILTYKEDKYQAPNEENNGYVTKYYTKYEFMKLDLRNSYITYSKETEKIPDDNSLEKYYEGGFRDIKVIFPGTREPFYIKFNCPSVRVVHKHIMLEYLDLCDYLSNTLKDLATKITLCDEDFVQTQDYFIFHETAVDTFKSYVNRANGNNNEYIDYFYEFLELNNFEFNAEKDDLDTIATRFISKCFDSLINHGFSRYKQIYRK